MKRLFAAVSASVAAAGICVSPAAAQPADDAATFEHRGWAGARLQDDPDSGCAMAIGVRGQAGFVVYASAKPAFKIGIGSRDWTLEKGQEGIAAVTFDDGPPILLKGAAISSATVLFEPMDLKREGGLRALLERARGVQLTFQGRSMGARLSGSSRAIRLLERCAAAPEREPLPPEQAEGATPPEQGRAVEFGFLRQGMDALEANAKLLEAGWQAESAEMPGEPAPELKAARERGLPAQSCAGAPATCDVLYADAYGNALKLTATGDEVLKVRGWRLNPPDEAKAEDSPENR